MSRNTFATAITCIDGRATEPVIKWVQQTFGVEWVDLVTEPGADEVLAEWRINRMLSIKASVTRSVEVHLSRLVAVAGHHDCAANPVDAREHWRQIARAVGVVKSWGLGVEVVGVWVDEHWQAGPAPSP